MSKLVDKIFTEKDLIEVTKLAESMTSEQVARQFGYAPTEFSRLKREQPKLASAYRKGAEIRSVVRISNNAYKKQNKKKEAMIKVKENNPSDLTTETALDLFNQQFKKNRERELRRELKNIDLL